jgi:predicted nucleotidyltransferase component of viral defense system
VISKQDILDRAAEWGLRPEVVEKDYVLGWLLAAIGQHAECSAKWVFKGGTCLKKCFFETYRFSEDLDFTLLPEAAYSPEAIQGSLTEVAANAYDMSGVQFRDVTLKSRRNKQGQETFEGRVYYQGPLQIPNWPKVSFDLSRHETVFPPFERRPIYHAYPDRLPDHAVVQTYSFPELLGEKLRALVERTRPRDLYDVVFIVENRAGEVDLTRTREMFVEKCRAKSITPPSPQQLLELVRGSGELRADWEGMLAHQLPQLPPIDAVLGRLDGVFVWTAEEVGAAPPPAPLEVIPLRRGEIVQAPRGVAFWGTPSAGLEAIRFAGSNRLLVEFDYTDQKGNTERRLVEPYSLRRSSAGDLLLYTFDRRRVDVRAFTVSRIRNVTVTQEVFVPRRVIELTSSGPIDAPAVERTSGFRQSRSSGGRGYVYACTVCGREFRHSEQNASLRKHRTAQGSDCPGRRGYFVRWE